jgi:hypothetical protein
VAAELYCPGMERQYGVLWLARVATLIAAVSVAACSPLASKGTMPPPGPDGQVDASGAPDFIAVAGRDGSIAGYVPKRFLFPAPTITAGPPAQPDVPVYADDLKTLVGHMVAGKGFVPLGTDPGAVPNLPVQQGPSAAAPSGPSALLTLYVRSSARHPAWFAVLAGGTLAGGQGYSGGIGVGCVDIGAGGQLVLLDRAPQDAGARILRSIYTRGQSGDLPTLWVDVGADGTISQGAGVPVWWPGDPQAC